MIGATQTGGGAKNTGGTAHTGGGGNTGATLATPTPNPTFPPTPPILTLQATGPAEAAEEAISRVTTATTAFSFMVESYGSVCRVGLTALIAQWRDDVMQGAGFADFKLNFIIKGFMACLAINLATG
jgi:hypothetical protein